jgi:hypothetical protein
MREKTTTRLPDLFPPYTPLRAGSRVGSRVTPRPVTPGGSRREARGATGSRERR